VLYSFLSEEIRLQIVETALTKVGAVFLRGRWLLHSRTGAGQGDDGGHLVSGNVMGGGEEFGDLVAAAAARLERSEVFGDQFAVRASSQLSDPYAVGNKFFVSGYPGIEFPQGLLEVSCNIIVKEVSVLTTED
jgi:hypothetical protein